MKRFEGQPFVLLGISADPDRKALKSALEKEGNTWRSWWDRDWDGPIQAAWNIRAYPTIFVIDAAGVVRFRSELGLPGKELEEVVESLLGTMPTEQPTQRLEPQPLSEAQHEPAR